MCRQCPGKNIRNLLKHVQFIMIFFNKSVIPTLNLALNKNVLANPFLQVYTISLKVRRINLESSF